MSVEPECIARIHSLMSAAAQRLNGERAAVLRLLDNGRYECKVEDDLDTLNKTIAIQPEKLMLQERVPLPSSGNTLRGSCMLFMPGEDGSESKVNFVSCFCGILRITDPLTLCGNGLTANGGDEFHVLFCCANGANCGYIHLGQPLFTSRRIGHLLCPLCSFGGRYHVLGSACTDSVLD